MLEFFMLIPFAGGELYILLLFLEYYWTALLLNACPITYRKLPSWDTSTRNHFSSPFCQNLPFLSFRPVPIPYKPLSYNFLVCEGLLKKLSNKPIQWPFWMNSIVFKKLWKEFGEKNLVPDFLLSFPFYPNTSQIDRGILFL